MDYKEKLNKILESVLSGSGWVDIKPKHEVYLNGNYVSLKKSQDNGQVEVTIYDFEKYTNENTIINEVIDTFYTIVMEKDLVEIDGKKFSKDTVKAALQAYTNF